MNLKLFSLVVATIALSTSIQAESMSLGDLLSADAQSANVLDSFAGNEHSQNLSFGNPEMRQCGQIAWRHTQPTLDQNTRARDLMIAAKEVLDQKMGAIHSAKRALAAELSAHPISKRGASQKAHALGVEAAPVMRAVFSAQIDIINLLSAQQRNVFNQVLRRCAQQIKP